MFLKNYLLRRKYCKIYKLYSSNRKRVARIDKNGEETVKYIFYILHFVDSARFMASSLSNLAKMKFIKLNVNTDSIIKSVKFA